MKWSTDTDPLLVLHAKLLEGWNLNVNTDPLMALHAKPLEG